jgi:hypothetical protein
MIRLGRSNRHGPKVLGNEEPSTKAQSGVQNGNKAYDHKRHGSSAVLGFGRRFKVHGNIEVLNLNNST